MPPRQTLPAGAHAGLLALTGLLVLACLSGCAAPYAPMGTSGGYEHQQLDERLFQVRFRGADPQRSRDLALLRAAEIGLALGYPQMVVRGSEYEEGVRSLGTGATYASSHGRYGGAYATPAYTTSRPGVTVLVEFYERPPEEPVLEAYACADLAAALRAHYDLEPTSP